MKGKTRSDRIFDIVNIVFMIVFLVIMIYPLYFIIIASISDPYDVVNGKVLFFPKGFTLDAYTNVFAQSRIWNGYKVTIINTFFGTLFSLILTIPAAYTLSKKELLGKGLLVVIFLITMFFGGGLIPTYLLVRSLGLIDKPVTLIILGSFSVFNMIVTRVYFQTSIPNELFESAYIDGSGEFRNFFQIALPLSKPILAVMALFYAVGRWNEYFNALIYINSDSLQPLQIILRSILLQNQISLEDIGGIYQDTEYLKDMARNAYVAESMKYSLIFIASFPLLVAYPFVQKHFTKGIMIGSLKG